VQHICPVRKEKCILLLYTRRDVVKTRHVAAFSYPGSYFFGFFSDKNEQSHLNTDISLTSRQFQNGKENEHINYTCLQQNKHACLDAWHPAHEVLSLISQFSIKRSHPN
jgi:hypothetical protein